MSGDIIEIFIEKKMAIKLFANSGDPGQMPHSAASDLGLHKNLPVTLLGVSRLQWVNISINCKDRHGVSYFEMC